jgi:hypothetical protein
LPKTSIHPTTTGFPKVFVEGHPAEGDYTALANLHKSVPTQVGVKLMSSDAALFPAFAMIVFKPVTVQIRIIQNVAVRA